MLVTLATGACSTARSESEPAATKAVVTTAKPTLPAEDSAQEGRLTNTELGRAVAEVDRNPRKAVAALSALQSKMPWIDDVLAYYTAVAKGREDRTAGRKDFEAFLGAHANSILLGDATVQLARLVEADGDTARAISLANQYGRRGGDDTSAAGVCLSAGRLLAAKDPGTAYVYLQCARTKAPLSNAARSAYELLTTLGRTNPSLRPADADGLMTEARLLAKEGRTADQVAALRELLTKYPDSPSAGEAILACGRSIGRSDSKSAGAAFFAKYASNASGARKAKLLYEEATLLWNDDRNSEAAKEFQAMLALKSGIGDEQQALYALARINDSQGNRREAIAYYGRAAALASGAPRADSRWRQAWVSYRADDFETAEQSFSSMAAGATRGSETDGRSEALYWQGRSLQHLGRKDAANDLFADVLREFPSGYYAAEAEQRLGQRGPARTGVHQPSAPKDLPPPAALAIRRATTLREAGLRTLAARDLSERLGNFDAATRRAVLPALPAAGAYDVAFRIAIKMQASGQLSSSEARVYFYPRAYAEIVDREAHKAGIDPTLVYALMRQESAFDSTAVSSAKALGLMQLLEKTAKRVAATSGYPEPSAEDLFDPAVNIRLGVGYLAMLSKEFDGNTALMAASYNAGEAAAARWEPLTKKYEQDEMIEQISYRETRGYVKAILRNMRNYRTIYGYSRDAL